MKTEGHASAHPLAPLRRFVQSKFNSAAQSKPGTLLLTDRGLAASSLVLLLLILLSAALGLRSISTVADNASWVSHTRQVRAQIYLLETTVLDAETGQRGYLLTGDATYLQPYNTARTQIDGDLAQLQALVSDNPTQLQRVAQLKPLIDAKMSELQQTIDLRQQGHLDQALALVERGTGLKLMNSIRSILNAADATEQQLLTQRDASTSSALRWAVFTLLLTTLLLMVLVAATYTLARRLLMDRERVAVERARLLEAERVARTEAEAATQAVTAAVHLRDQFLSIASHELRTPLTVMLTNLQLLQRRLARENENAERFRPTIEGVKRQIDRMRALIEAMLDVSRIESGQLSIVKQRLDLVELVRGLTRDTQATTEAHTLRLEAPEQPIFVEGDAIRLEQVVQNLLNNAVKYSPDGGTITVRVATLENDAQIDVTDEGIGIPPDAMEHLFERYYRAPGGASERITGMGIGLYVVRQIARLHGGDVGVESTPGAGSTFTVRLPLDASNREVSELALPSEDTRATRETPLPESV